MKMNATTSRPSFEYDVLVCESFDELLERRGRHATVDALSSLALEWGRVLLQAPGGAGKTTTMEDVLQAARHTMFVAFAEAVEVAAALPAEAYLAEDALKAIEQRVPEIYHVAGRGETCLLLLDGLNEISPEQAVVLLEAVDILATRFPGLGIVVSDRLNRRNVETRDWALVTLGQVPNRVIRKIVGKSLESIQMSVLRNPYYLEEARVSSANISMRSMAHYDYLVRHAGLSSDDISRLAEAGFEQYGKSFSRRVNLQQLRSKIGKSFVANLRATGVLVDDVAPRFVHHLLGDYLAATYLASNPHLWGQDNFDILTFRATSFDGLAMIAEQRPSDVDALLVSVYDWNVYAAAYLLAEDRNGLKNISRDLETAILAILAEKRFDQVVATAEQVSDALRLYSTSLSAQLLAASSLEDILGLVARQSMDGEYAEWQRLFCGARGEISSSEIAQKLSSNSPLVGWTAANVLRRSPDWEVRDSVRTQLTSPSASTRWRAAHALGSFTENVVVDDLLYMIEKDSYMWARYGALRSLIEIAAKGAEDVQRYVFGGLAELANVISSDERLLREAERTLVMRNAPEAWPDSAGLLLERLWALSDSVAGQDRWRRVAARLQG
ncbi:HEAT repeat domain-containing protein [Streptomyces chartreusis]|uniref:HEAT repeat domain-containing protein n=1 Tax=Streptomyces chartreusis TaxID=1969 RepID=UPI0036D017D6